MDKNKKIMHEKNNKESNSSNRCIPIDEVHKLLEKQEQEILKNLNVQLTQIRQGPTPPPSELRELKQIDPSFPNRVIAMAEKEQKFRHKSTYIGQINFILLVLFGFIIAGITGYFGSQIVGSVIATGVSYISYVFKAKEPQAPKNKTKSKEK